MVARSRKIRIGFSGGCNCKLHLLLEHQRSSEIPSYETNISMENLIIIFKFLNHIVLKSNFRMKNVRKYRKELPFSQ
jgi:hypothetical protein